MGDTDDRFRELCDRQAPADLDYLVRRLPQPADAGDVLADVFVVAWRRIAEVPDGAAAATDHLPAAIQPEGPPAAAPAPGEGSVDPADPSGPGDGGWRPLDTAAQATCVEGGRGRSRGPGRGRPEGAEPAGDWYPATCLAEDGASSSDTATE